MTTEPRSYLVTGGAGFIGSALVHLLVSRGHRVVTLDLLTYAGNVENLRGLTDTGVHTFIKGSINDRPLVAHLLRDHHIDFLINTAAETHVDRSIDGPEAFIQTNIVGTSSLLDVVLAYVRETKKPIRYVQVSTDEVYGTIQSGAFYEDNPFRPNSPYAASKASADLLVRSYVKTYGLDAVLTNGSNTYGPRQFPEKLIPLMTLNAIEGKPLPVYGDGKNIRDWLYVDDHAKGICAAAEKGKAGENYNIGGAMELENIELVNMLCKHLDRLSPRNDGVPYAQQIKFVEDRPGHDFRYALSTEKAQTELHWHPVTDFKAGFEKTVSWYLANQKWRDLITEQRYARERLGRTE